MNLMDLILLESDVAGAFLKGRRPARGVSLAVAALSRRTEKVLFWLWISCESSPSSDACLSIFI